jgi:hypothetical protein
MTSVEDLRTRISAGEYDIDGEAVATAIVRRIVDRRGVAHRAELAVAPAAPASPVALVA